MTRREPSPVLVGLATRLSVVCGYPLKFALFQPREDLGDNIVATILGTILLPLLLDNSKLPDDKFTI